MWEFLLLLNKTRDSRHAQLAMNTAFPQESKSAVGIDQLLHPEEKIKKNNLRES